MTLAELEKVKESTGSDARYSDGGAYLSVFRFDDDMIMTSLLTHHVVTMPSVHLHRHQ